MPRYNGREGGDATLHIESEDYDLKKVDIYVFSMLIYDLFAGDKPWMRILDYSAADLSEKWCVDIKTQALAAKDPNRS